VRRWTPEAFIARALVIVVLNSSGVSPTAVSLREGGSAEGDQAAGQRAQRQLFGEILVHGFISFPIFCDD
jgi:hypothetical protein